MSEFDKNNNIPTDANEDMNTNETKAERVWTADGAPEQELPHVEDLTEEEIYKILQEDAGDIEPPPSLSPASIEKMLQGVKQEQKGRRSPWVIVAGMAACLVFGVMAGLLTFSLIHSRDIKTSDPTPVTAEPGEPESQADPDVVAELDYDQVCDIINGYNSAIVSERDRYKNIEYQIEDATQEEAAPAAESNEKSESASTDGFGEQINSATAPNSGASSDYSKTDEQVAGVEEGDIVKTDGKHIFTIEASTFGFTIHVIEPNGSRSKEIGQIEIPNCDCSEMYINENQIIVIGNEWMLNQNGGIDRMYYAGRSYARGNRTGARTLINIVDISDPTRPRIAKTHSQTGTFNTSRISDGHLYTFTEDTYYREEPYVKNTVEEYIPKIDEEAMPIERIVRAGDEDTNNYMVLMSIALDGSNEITDRMAVLGGGATYYVSTDNIYIARNTTYEKYLWGFGYDEQTTLTTSLNKFSYNNGQFTKGPSTTFRGYIDNSYYMHEYQGNFCFVYMNLDSGMETVNGLCVMDGNLNKLGELRNIAPGEQIYASYYMDNMAYFVTYRNTDPVFAVDLSDPTAPRLCSELKIPGFSSYLHSFGENQLIGIGYGDASKDGQGWDDTAKLSLFEIGKDYDIKELSKTFAEQGSRHIADENHRAVFVDEKRGLIGLGLAGGNDNNNSSRPIDDQRYVVYQLNGSQLVKVMDTSDDPNISALVPYSTRGLRIGETFYVCNGTGVQSAYAIGSHGAKWKKA